MIKLILDTRYKSKEGRYPVVIYFRGKQPIRIRTGQEAKEDEFEDGKFVTKVKNYKILNSYINNMYVKVLSEITSLQATGELKSMKDSVLRDRINSLFVDKKKESDFVVYFKKFVSLKTNPRTIDLYEKTLSKMQEFDSDLTFEKIDVDWLKGLEKKWKEDGLKTNYIAIHMRNIRAIFNYALDEEVITAYPFRKFKIKKEVTAKRNLTLEQLRELFTMPVEDFQVKYVDYFKLIFYLIGINISDLLSLTKDNLINGRIEYHRHKTNRFYSIKVEPEAMELINKYRGTDHLINIMDTYGTYTDFTKKINTSLQHLGTFERRGRGGKKIIDRKFPHLSTYWARHTWATMASELDIPVETISMALGHALGSEVTNIYINFNHTKIDEANRKVIDYVLGY